MTHVKNIILSFLIFSNINLNAQTSNFERGFKYGFERGYCNKSVSNYVTCIPPLSPIPPMPLLNESKDSWSDGYDRGYWVGFARREQDDNSRSISNNKAYVPRFNPYITQNPILYLTLEEREIYFRNRALVQQQQAEAWGNLIGLLLTPRTRTAEEIRQIDLRKQQRKNDLIRRKNELIEKRENNRLIVGSNAYNLCRKNKNKWLVAVLITGTSSGIAYTLAKNYAAKYPNATDNASSIRKTGNALYQIAPALLFTSGIALINFTHNHIRIKKAKTKPQSINSNINFNEKGLCFSIDF